MIIRAKQSVEVEVTKEELFNALLEALYWSESSFNNYLYKDGKFFTMELVNYHRGEYDWEECEISEGRKEEYLFLLTLKGKLLGVNNGSTKSN